MLTTSPAYNVLATNSQQTPTIEEDPCPSSHTEQGQIACADFENPICHSSPTEATAHSCKSMIQIHSPALPHTFCHQEASLNDRKQPEIDESPETN